MSDDHPPRTTAIVSLDGAVVRVDDLVFEDAAVAAYLAALQPQQLSDHLVRAIGLGVHGLMATSMQATVDTMRDEVRRILDTAGEAAEVCLSQAVDAGSATLAAQLDPEVRSSLTSRVFAELEQVHTSALAQLDPDRTDSHSARLVAAISEMLGPGGLLATRLEEALDSSEADSGLGRIMETLERRFQEMRDLVVGAQQREEEALRGTAKGRDFEDVVEQILRLQARAIGGCVVERTSAAGGTLGSQAKVGDFVVTLDNGRSIAVEAKNAARVSLGGPTGILAELDQAMDNRNADWGICVSHNEAFPAEVGSFNVYGNRILVVDPGDGVLTGVALRWASAAARADAAGDELIDTPRILERLDRIRDLTKHFSRSKKALSTAQGGLDSVREDLEAMRSSLIELADDITRELQAPAIDRKVA